MRWFRSVALLPVLVLVACTDDAPSVAGAAWSPELVAAELAVARAGCVRCHPDPAADRARRLPLPGPSLDEAVRWRATDGGAAWLARHHAGAAAPDVAAWLIAIGAHALEPSPTTVLPGAEVQGERLVHTLACGACHAPAMFDELAGRTDHARLAHFLAKPAARFPAIVHPPLAPAEAADVATWLLRAQRIESPPQPGFGWFAWPLRIRDEGLPELAGIAPAHRGVADRIDASRGLGKHHFVLRFDATLDVPAAGEWTLIAGSDDGSWLWIDDQLLVRNEALAPHRRRERTVPLTAGRHALRVLYTQAEGGASLEVRWRGPGVDDEPIPAERATTSFVELVPPVPPPAPAADQVERGRHAARARRCDACHAIADDAFAALPAPPLARPWSELRATPCPQVPGAEALHASARAAAEQPESAAADLAAAMLRDGCTSCHVRDGRGGLPPAVRDRLAAVEDLGDEGRLPPDLTRVGRRLRQPWIERVLQEGLAVRPYLRVRMPVLPRERARQYAAWFAAVDGVDDRAEPPFTVEFVQRGRQLAGVGGRNCITCHSFAGLPSLGPQGMDLAMQHQRLQPGWFADWLLHPTELRPGTRMPALWWRVDDAARAEVDAIWSWLSLGSEAPLPPGIKAADGSLRLVASDRPRLHGAFLDGVSARCLAVGTPERTHFAYDLETPALVWLWRGDFLDASGTWSGRAGKLLLPAGENWHVLQDATIRGGGERRLLGQRRSADGYPILQVAAGEAEYEDETRPLLVASGSAVVRTLRVVRGEVAFEFPSAPEGLRVLVGDADATQHALAAGQALEVVYRW